MRSKTKKMEQRAILVTFFVALCFYTNCLNAQINKRNSSGIKYFTEFYFETEKSNYEDIVDLKCFFRIWNGSVYLGFKNSKILAYRLLRYNIKKKQVDTVVLKNDYIGLIKGKKHLLKFNQATSFAINGKYVCILFNDSNQKSTLCLYRRMNTRLYKLMLVKKMSTVYNYVWLTKYEILLGAYYRYHPIQRKNCTELLALNYSGEEKGRVTRESNQIPLTLFEPFSMIDVGKKSIVWGEPNIYSFKIFSAKNLTFLGEHSLSKNSWKILEDSLCKYLSGERWLHPKRVIDTIVKVASDRSIVYYYSYLNNRTLFVNYSILNSVDNKRKYYFDIWRTRNNKFTLDNTFEEHVPQNLDLIVNKCSYPIDIFEKTLTIGENYIVSVDLDSRISNLNQSLSSYTLNKIKDLLENKPVLKFVVFKYE